MPKKYHGIILPIVVPIDEHENVDEAAFRKLIRYSIEGGVDGIFVASSNSEVMALRPSERDRSIRIALDECNSEVQVMAGVMDSSTARVLDNVKRLEQMGGTTAVVTPVFYARHATPKETIRHFEKITNETDLDILIYNIPIFTGANLKADTIVELSKMDHIVGYKDSSGNMAEFMKCLHHFYDNPHFSLFQGATNISAVSMLMGADGCVPSTAALFPRLFAELYKYAKMGDIARVRTLDRIVCEANKIFSLAKNQTSATKYAVSTLGFFPERPALPTEPVTADEKNAIDHQVKVVWEMMLKEGIK